ncbi:MAG TPA: DUF2752 domain-containing protein [Acidobacteriaceae bacterium]|nr:DUF2752 domain-containing protein [Acidobacteriaceae bacterium]
MHPVTTCGTKATVLRRRIFFAHAALIASALLCVVLARFPPERYTFYPRCPIHQFFGIECPGCGATRALSALLHGHLSEALRFNALFVLLLPAILAFAITTYRRALQTKTFSWPNLPAPATYAALAAAALFTIVRNLPH